MKSSEIYKELYDWVKAVLPSANVIQSYQNAPIPKGHFIMIDRLPNAEPIGIAEQAVPGENGVIRPRVHMYKGSIQLWEVNGTDYLYSLLETLQDQDDGKSPSGLSVLNVQGPVFAPNLVDGSTQWQTESTMTLNIMWFHCDSKNPAYVERVDVDGKVRVSADKVVDASVSVSING